MRVLVLLVLSSLCVSFGAPRLRSYESVPVEYDDATQYLPNKAQDGLEAARNRFAQVNSFMTAAATVESPSSPDSTSKGGNCQEEHDCDTKEQQEEDAKRNSHFSTDMDESRDQELADAEQTIKDQIVQKATQIKAEKKWVKEVTALVEEYVHKIRKVNANIRLMQKTTKDLFRKKKQIQNLILQRQLERKLRVATADLNTLQSAMENVKKKEQLFMKSKQEIRQTVGAIEEQMKALKGEETEEGHKHEHQDEHEGGHGGHHDK